MMRYASKALFCGTLLSSGLLSTCGPVNHHGSAVKEAWDIRNDPRIFGLVSMKYDELSKKEMLQGALDQKPWADDYWPFHKKSLASRYITGMEFSSFDEQVSQAIYAPSTNFLSPGEKYDLIMGDQSFTLTRESWRRYQYYYDLYGKDTEKWSWMGICSGWAPASISEKAPGGNVLVRNTAGQEVLFFEGDIRGLLSKVYDVNKLTKGHRVIGTRCNEQPETVIRDEHGRAIDGYFKTTGERFTILRDHSTYAGALAVRLQSQPRKVFWLAASKPFRTRLSGDFAFYLYDNNQDLDLDLKEGSIGERASSSDAMSVYLYKACRDVNPASLHLALAQLIGAKANTPFVIELFRHEAVWNFPMWGYNSEFSNLRTMSQDQATTRAYRAPGTAFIVDVRTKLVHAGLMGRAMPMYYGEEDHKLDWQNLDQSSARYRMKDLRYSLEFDARGYLIGGEWRESSIVHSNIPDFFWRVDGQPTDQLPNGKDSYIKYSVIKKILECSHKPADREILVNLPNGQSYVSAVTCPL